MTSRRNILPLAAALALLIAALFSNLKNASFIDLDDGVYVMGNPNVTTGLTSQNIAWAFSTHNKAGFWIPLTWLSLQLDATLAGNTLAPSAPNRLPDAPPPLASATVYHLHNIFLHIVAAILLFLFLEQATGLIYPAFLAAMLWAIHPLRVESVAWVTERKDVLAAVFGFLALLLYVRWARRPNWLTFTATAVAFALSLMAKPMFVTLPALLLLLDFWPLARLQTAKNLFHRALEKWPLWLLSVAISIMTVITQKEVQAVKTMNEIGIAARLGHAVTSYLTYLTAHIKVWNLAPNYPFRPTSTFDIAFAVTLLVLITALCIRQGKRRPWLIVGWLWFIIAFLPMIGLVQSGDQAWADRFSHLPSVGLFILLLFTAHELWQKLPAARIPLAASAALLTIFFAFFTVRQTTYWHNSVTLFTRAVAINPDNFQLHGTLAVALLREGENEQALQQYQQAAEIRPDFAPARLSVGYLELELGQYELAFREIGTAAKLDPWNPKAHYLHGVALEKAGHPDGAALEYQNTLNLAPDYPNAKEALDRAKTLDAQRLAPQIGPLITP